MMSDILLIEDNIELANLLKTFLNKEGFSLCHMNSGEAALAWLAHHRASIILLDIMLPGIDGFAVCKAVRQQGRVPILIITARSDKQDQLTGFELGADDYLEKPIDIDILIARVKALRQRAYGKETQDILYSGSIKIDKNAHLAYLDHQKLDLNVKEYELLMLFASNPGKTLHKDYLFHQIWGMDSESENQTLTVHIKMLRDKIEDNAREPKRIQTVWGVGYRYEEI